MMMVQTFSGTVLLSILISISMLVFAPMQSLALGQGSSNLYLPAMPTMNTTLTTSATIFVGVGVGEYNNFDIDMDSLNDFLRDDAASPSVSSSLSSSSTSLPSSSSPTTTTTSQKTRTVANLYTGRRERGQQRRNNSIARNLLRLRDMFCTVNRAFDHLVMK